MGYDHELPNDLDGFSTYAELLKATALDEAAAELSSLCYDEGRYCTAEDAEDYLSEHPEAARHLGDEDLEEVADRANFFLAEMLELDRRAA
ncbi:hypothetical protein [Sutterella sp.]|uniref:hypothetical protein n=1 Tax=Sutterella sp. TaxID=1981025 RepID=UPI0026DEF364|nr:hypothetical protein [Sutterella sp.]MDO5532580.1 hypothetical protein [Sutterella sp.]